jgi:hypothetical protein
MAVNDLVGVVVDEGELVMRMMEAIAGPAAMGLYSRGANERTNRNMAVEIVCLSEVKKRFGQFRRAVMRLVALCNRRSVNFTGTDRERRNWPER